MKIMFVKELLPFIDVDNSNTGQISFRIFIYDISNVIH